MLCLLALVVLALYALYKNYTVRLGAKTLGAGFFFEASKKSDEPERRTKKLL
jgi:hypothetical protein